ncbi:MAG: (2Fe-2S)-binding protein [Candidatus Marinimicrobia bacterium]|nr:(2Fe-2S)-binding protein [Candidatus Neomarinimicrobiota bacterium]
MLYTEDIGYFDLVVTVNGCEVRRRVATHQRLLDFLRDDLRLTGTKEVCGEGECGACTVILNGETVNSCLILAVEAHDSHIVTIEGLSADHNLTDLQQAFVEKHSVQCGYCIPGMILSADHIHRDCVHPEYDEIKQGLAGNICRCIGYHKIIDAVEQKGDR